VPVITDLFAKDFAQDWVEAWNAHDLPRVLAHYTDDFEMSSPFIAQFTGEPVGKLKGKENVAAYWRTALERLPKLRFELLHVHTGASSVVLVYQTNFGRKAAEAFFFNEAGLVERAAAHYCED
jgi:ketosteroid isomerase-like protein